MGTEKYFADFSSLVEAKLKKTFFVLCDKSLEVKKSEYYLTS